MYLLDFLFRDGEWMRSGGFQWIYLCREGMEMPVEFDSIDFEGGLYAVATGIDQQTDEEDMRREVDIF